MKKVNLTIIVMTFSIAICGAIARFELTPTAQMTGVKWRNQEGLCVDCYINSSPICTVNITNEVCKCININGPSGTLVSASGSLSCEFLYRL